MRIVLIGQAAFGAKVLEALQEAGKEVVAVYAPPDRPGGKGDPLKELALSRGLPVRQPSSYKDDQVFDQYCAFAPDLTVLAFVTDIIHPRYFEAAKHGAICYHPSLLPRHRGGSAINWAIIMGDKRTGLTIFWPDGGIDTGPVLLQKEVEIGPEDTTGSLYFDRLFPMGVEAILEAVGMIEAGRAPRMPQDESAATYEPLCDDKVAGIDWQKSLQAVHNLIRGCDPQPGAYAFYRDEKVRFYGAKRTGEAVREASGTVVQVSSAGMTVAVGGESLLITSVRGAAGGKVAAGDWCRDRGVRPGDSFQ